MLRLSLQPKSPGARRRARVLFWVLFGLLAVHAVLVHAVPEFAMLSRGGRVWLARGAPAGIEDRPPTIIKRNGRTYLRGGVNDGDHFDITEFRLDPDRLHYGLGRERFAALTEPQFAAVSEADEWVNDSERVLAVKVDDQVRVYPLDILRRHEVVNDVVGGRPIFAAFCFLADLGAVYDRRIDDHTYTFAVSGYTYADPEVLEGGDAFVLWDRDTESLWWPGSGKAVSGPMIDTPLPLLEADLWAQTTWAQVKGEYAGALVLKPGQDLHREGVTFGLAGGAPTRRKHAPVPPEAPGDDDSIAPRWGGNPKLRADDPTDR